MVILLTNAPSGFAQEQSKSTQQISDKQVLELVHDFGAAGNRACPTRETGFGPKLDPFYKLAQALMQRSKTNCILPLSPEMSIGATFDEAKITAALKNKFGGKAWQWRKLPDWMAGLWSLRDVPARQKVTEIDGDVWDDPPPSLSLYWGPGPYAHRIGCIQSKNGWWDYSNNQISDFWCAPSIGGDGKPTVDGPILYSFTHRHQPLLMPLDGIVVLRETTVFFQVKPSSVKQKPEVLLPPGPIKSVWQEDKEEVFKVFDDKQVARYSATRTYGWNGAQLNRMPGDSHRRASDAVAWQKKIGDAKAFPYSGKDVRKMLIAYLTKNKMQDEIKLLKPQ